MTVPEDSRTVAGMSCRCVSVSGPDGAQMRDVAQGVAERLGFSLVDEAIVMRAAAEAGVEPQVVENVEKRQSFMDRLLDTFATACVEGVRRNAALRSPASRAHLGDARRISNPFVLERTSPH